jgi:hypothetical protein
MIHEIGQIAGEGLAALIFLEYISKFFVECKQKVAKLGTGTTIVARSFLRLHWLCVDHLAPDDCHFGYDLPDILSRDSHVINRNDHKVSKLPCLDRSQDVFRKHNIGTTHGRSP